MYRLIVFEKHLKISKRLNKFWIFSTEISYKYHKISKAVEYFLLLKKHKFPGKSMPLLVALLL